jgi:thiamine pyrophosphate-dependent acetolactate synthase large subunit-like protein
VRGEAFRQLKARKGPFVLNMPQDVQHAALPDQKWTYRPMYKAKVSQPPRAEDVAEATKILANAKRPTILCGLGAAQGKAEPEVQKLAEYLGAPVATTLPLSIHFIWASAAGWVHPWRSTPWPRATR